MLFAYNIQICVVYIFGKDFFFISVLHLFLVMLHVPLFLFHMFFSSFSHFCSLIHTPLFNSSSSILYHSFHHTHTHINIRYQLIVHSFPHPSTFLFTSYSLICVHSLSFVHQHIHTLSFSHSHIYSIIRTRNRSICQLFSNIFNQTIKQSLTHSLLSGPVCLMA